MQGFRLRRRFQELVLDAIFVGLLAHFFVTGHVVPPAFIDLFRDQPAVVAVSPHESPAQAPEPAPA
ncbi:MAG TPA: hypothetical protein VG845_04365, partial [Dehalococcoidia bacterium]|nr:hypothetical protein [Dehalococcoidia bacterium]